MEIIIGLIITYLVGYLFVKAASSKKVEPPKRASSSQKPAATPGIKVRIEVSGPGECRREYDHQERPSGKPAKWYGAGRGVSVQGYDIAGGLIYVGDTLPDAYGYRNDACLINPRLKILPGEPWDGGDEMGYWPQYDHIPAKCRGSYLKWLVSGRSEPEAYIGYVFLFFYGLERRLFIDGQKGEVAEEERGEIVKEVNRLIKIYGGNRSFKGYASNFLAMEWVLYQSEKPIPDYLDFNDRYCSEPFQVILAKYVAAEKAIPADVALHWMILHPEFGLRTPARRCAKEFRELFVRRYNQKFGDGLIVKPNKTPLKLEYRAASGSIPRDLKLKIPDLPNPFILTSPLKKLSSLVEECTTALEPYSRFMGRKDNDPNSIAAMSLLPKELMNQAPGLKNAHDRLTQVCSGESGLISVNDLYECLGRQTPLQIGKKDSESLASLVEGMGFGMAPDVRFHHIKPSPDGMVAIFAHGHGTDFRPSKEFGTVSTILRLGAIVSQTDKEVSPEEEVTLQSIVRDNRELTQTEKESLIAFLHWSLDTPQGTAGLKQKLSGLGTAEKSAISRILISIAYADGRVDPKEIKQLEKLFSTLGLEKEQVTSGLHALAAAYEPVTVSLRDQETTFSIPKPTTGSGISKGFRLNEELIRIREEETRQVKGVLEGIFVDQTEEQNILAPAISSSNPLLTLDQAHQDFFHRLLKQEAWERTDLYDICKELGLMADGAMEVLNELAFNSVNAPLIDDGDPIIVDVNLGKEMINA